MLIDTHAHVNFRAYQDDAQEVLQRALNQGVWVVNVGSQVDTSRQSVAVAELFNEGVYAVVGLHPEHTHSQYVDEEETHFKTREEDFDYEIYKTLASNPKVVGIGECGLDYYRLPEAGDIAVIKEKQRSAFRSQVRLAKELGKALVVHSRPEKGNEGLYDDLLAILDEEDTGDLRFVVHSFTGSPEAAQRFLDRGGYISFNGIITFDKTGNMEKLVRMTPMERILLETDSPYLSPPPHRGKRNEPAYVRLVAEKLAGIKGIDVGQASSVTTENAFRLFKLGR